MTELEVLAAIGVGEDSDWEFKAAQGGLPANVWETYSGMANTDGGTIVLGVKEKAGSFEIIGLPNPAQIKKAIWDCVNVGARSAPIFCPRTMFPLSMLPASR